MVVKTNVPRAENGGLVRSDSTERRPTARAWRVASSPAAEPFECHFRLFWQPLETNIFLFLIFQAVDARPFYDPNDTRRPALDLAAPTAFEVETFHLAPVIDGYEGYKPEEVRRIDVTCIGAGLGGITTAMLAQWRLKNCNLKVLCLIGLIGRFADSEMFWMCLMLVVLDVLGRRVGALDVPGCSAGSLLFRGLRLVPRCWKRTRNRLGPGQKTRFVFSIKALAISNPDSDSPNPVYFLPMVSVQNYPPIP